jgi:hypothetical protein
MMKEFQQEFDIGHGTVIRVSWNKRLHNALEEYYAEFCTSDEERTAARENWQGVQVAAGQLLQRLFLTTGSLSVVGDRLEVEHGHHLSKALRVVRRDIDGQRNNELITIFYTLDTRRWDRGNRVGGE